MGCNPGTKGAPRLFPVKETSHSDDQSAHCTAHLMPGSSLTNAFFYVCTYVDQRLSSHAAHQEVSRCPTRSESEESTLALKPRANITRSPKQGFQCSHKKTDVLQKLDDQTITLFLEVIRLLILPSFSVNQSVYHLTAFILFHFNNTLIL